MDFIFRLCPALKAIFEHGLKKSTILGGNCHPWLFIEEVSHFLTKCMKKKLILDVLFPIQKKYRKKFGALRKYLYLSKFHFGYIFDTRIL